MITGPTTGPLVRGLVRSAAGLGLGFKPGLPKVIYNAILAGDSIMGQNINGAYHDFGAGQVMQARWLMGCPFNVARTPGGARVFATGGFRTDQWIPTYLNQAAATSAELFIDNLGINDVFQQVVTMAQSVINRRLIWYTMLAAGKHVIAIGLTPVGLAASGNAAGVVSARAKAYDDAFAAAALEMGIPYVRINGPMEATPNNNDWIGNYPAMYLPSDPVHPNAYGAFVQGPLIRNAINTYAATNGLRFGVDTFNMGGTMITPNGDFATGASSPSGFNCYFPTNGSNGTMSMRTDGNGIRWWRIPLNKGTSTSFWTINTFGYDGTGANANCDAVCMFQVVSGTISTLSFEMWSQSPANGSRAGAPSPNSGIAYTSAHGIQTFRTEKYPMNGSTALVYPNLVVIPELVSGTNDAVIEVARCHIRRFP